MAFFVPLLPLQYSLYCILSIVQWGLVMGYPQVMNCVSEDQTRHGIERLKQTRLVESWAQLASFKLLLLITTPLK